MLKQGLIAELKHEAASTKKMLERVPLEKADWKPDEKSMSVGRLATHIAEIPAWTSRIATMNEFDFLKDYTFNPHVAATTEELLNALQVNVDKAISDLSNLPDEDFDKHWVVKRGEQVMFDLPKKVAVRGWTLSHLIHHRGQLSVYLRLLGVPVPGMYGPSADEQM
jgi:uncharacterized damage-inducible protein DinB